MRNRISLLLITTFLASSLTGCGQLVQSPLNPMAASEVEAASQKSDAMAREFALQIQKRFTGLVSTRGSVVTLRYQLMAPTVYDFSKTPKSGLVKVSTKDYEVEMPLSKVMQQGEFDALPALVIPIAIEVALGAAKGLSIYWLTHRGDKFNKQEAIKATAVGMLASLIPFVGNIPVLDQVFPLAVSVLSASKTLHYKDIAEAALGLVDEIVIVISQIKWKKK
jgi:predicted small lipoprotein YifL